VIVGHGTDFESLLVVWRNPLKQAHAACSPAHISVQCEVQGLRKGLNGSTESILERNFKIDKMVVDWSQINR